MILQSSKSEQYKKYEKTCNLMNLKEHSIELSMTNSRPYALPNSHPARISHITHIFKELKIMWIEIISNCKFEINSALLMLICAKQIGHYEAIVQKIEHTYSYSSGFFSTHILRCVWKRVIQTNLVQMCLAIGYA